MDRAGSETGVDLRGRQQHAADEGPKSGEGAWLADFPEREEERGAYKGAQGFAGGAEGGAASRK